MNKIISHNNKKAELKYDIILCLKYSLKNKNILDTSCFLINCLLCPRRRKLYHSEKKIKGDTSSNIIPLNLIPKGVYFSTTS